MSAALSSVLNHDWVEVKSGAKPRRGSGSPLSSSEAPASSAPPPPCGLTASRFGGDRLVLLEVAGRVDEDGGQVVGDGGLEAGVEVGGHRDGDATITAPIAIWTWPRIGAMRSESLRPPISRA